MTATAYQQLERVFHRLGVLGDVLGLIHWDTAVMMPAGAAAARGEQMATLKALQHELLTAPAVADLLDAAATAPLDPWQRANLREMRRRWIHAAAVPAALVTALSKASTACEMAWRQARPAADYAAVRPHLAQVLALVREEAEAQADRLGCSPYEALLDQYEPGGRSKRIDAIFDDLAAFLPGFLAAVLERQGPPPPGPPGPFPLDRQKALAETLMRSAGFDFNRGRLDVSLHPFCGGATDDVRITTRYDEADFAPALMGVMHETGHALYELGLPAAWRHQPVGRARGMSLHESQSLLVEMQACRSRDFLAFAAPLIRGAFDGDGPAWSDAALHARAIRVEPGHIRVDADEVTYPAHVILRYRLEQALIDGTLDLADLPAAWAEGMRGLLGIAPPDDRRGCLQDIHWYDGAFGYFPTYTLGAMTAAQLFDAACRAEPEILPALGRGDFAPLLGWLRAHVHAKGSLPESADALLIEATGAPLDPARFKQHLRRRYLGVD